MTLDWPPGWTHRVSDAAIDSLPAAGAWRVDDANPRRFRRSGITRTPPDGVCMSRLGQSVAAVLRPHLLTLVSFIVIQVRMRVCSVKGES